MGVSEILIVFFISSWLVFFAVAGIGTVSQEEAGEVAPGTEPSAPTDPQIGKKAIWACAGGAIFTFVFWLLMTLDAFRPLMNLVAV